MLENSFGLLFFLKQSKNSKPGKKYVYLRITVDGLPKELSTKLRWANTRWDQDTGRAIGSKEDARSLNEYLDSISIKVTNARKQLLDKDEQVSAEILKNVVLGKDNRKMILDVFADHNRKMEALVGKDFADGTLERYETSYDHTRAFMQWQYQVDNMDIRKLNNYFIEQYAFWLKSVRNCNHNTTMKYLANFKKIVLICVKNKWLPGDPFANFKLTKKEVIRTPLSALELETITRRNFDNDRLNNVRDIFVFCCYTGLAYADIKKLNRSEIMQGIDGEQWIFTPRQKTSTPSRIPLLPMALEILNKYASHPKCLNEGKALPVLSNQKMNAYLKEIGDVCGIKKVLTFHLARHTFATTVTLSNGVPIDTVSKMLGHKTMSQTQHYAKILDNKISRDMAELRKKYATSPEPSKEEEYAETRSGSVKEQKMPLQYNYILV